MVCDVPYACARVRVQTKGATPLFVASEHGCVEAVRMLLDAGGAVNQAMVRESRREGCATCVSALCNSNVMLALRRGETSGGARDVFEAAMWWVVLCRPLGRLRCVWPARWAMWRWFGLCWTRERL
jgi:hypothetical protein